MRQDVIEFHLAADIAAGGTFTVPYPPNRATGSYAGYATAGHTLNVYGCGYTLKAPKDFTLSFGSSLVTVNLASGVTARAGRGFLGLSQQQAQLLGRDEPQFLADVLGSGVTLLPVVRVNFGSPAAADTTALIKTATGSELPDGSPTSKTYTRATVGTGPQDGAADNWDTPWPRNVTATATHASSVVACTVTVNGYDLFGEKLTEDLAVGSGSTSKTATGKKAFAKIESIVISDADDLTDNTISVGWGNTLGIPVHLGSLNQLTGELINGKPVDQGQWSVTEVIGSADLLAGTAHTVPITEYGVIKAVQATAADSITGGGAVSIGGGGANTVTLTFANSSGSGTTKIGFPSADTVTGAAVDPNDDLVIAPAASFNTAGSLVVETVFKTPYARGVVQPASSSTPTATTGDCRGTYTPASSVLPNGSNTYWLDIALLSPGYKGNPQYYDF